MAIARDIMTRDPVFASPLAPLREVAWLMLNCDCGEIPIVDQDKLVGVITDRDITIRTVAKGLNPLDMVAQDCMTRPAIYVSEEMDVSECMELLAAHQIRRLPVVDQSLKLTGILTQADIAECEDSNEVGMVVRQISQSPATLH